MTPPASGTPSRDFLTDATLLKESAYIGGAWVGGRSTIVVRNPANGETIGHVPDLGAEETHRAIAAAGVAFPQWRGPPAGEPRQGLPPGGPGALMDRRNPAPPPSILARHTLRQACQPGHLRSSLCY